MTTDHSDPAGLERIRSMYGITDAGCQAMRGPEKPKGCWNTVEGARPTVAVAMTLRAVETEAGFLGMDPFTALGAFLAATKLGRGTSSSRDPGLQALG